MICPECSATVSDGANFCPVCGADLQAWNAVPPTQGPSAAPVQQGGYNAAANGNVTPQVPYVQDGMPGEQTMGASQYPMRDFTPIPQVPLASTNIQPPYGSPVEAPKQRGSLLVKIVGILVASLALGVVVGVLAGKGILPFGSRGGGEVTSEKQQGPHADDGAADDGTADDSATDDGAVVSPDDEVPAEPGVLSLDVSNHRYRLNVFLSNFTEAGMITSSEPTLERDESSVARVVGFAFMNCALNDGSVENCNKVLGGYTYYTRIRTPHLDYASKYLFGKTYDWKKLAGEHDGLFCYKSGYVYCKLSKPMTVQGPAYVTEVEAIEGERYRVRMDSYARSGGYDYNQMDTSIHRLSEDGLNDLLGVSGPNQSLEAIVEAKVDGKDVELTLLSIELM